MQVQRCKEEETLSGGQPLPPPDLTMPNRTLNPGGCDLADIARFCYCRKVPSMPLGIFVYWHCPRRGNWNSWGWSCCSLSWITFCMRDPGDELIRLISYTSISSLVSRG